MNKRVKSLAVVLIILVLISVIHSTFHFYFFRIGISGLDEIETTGKTSIGGLAIGEEDVGEERTRDLTGVTFSQIMIIAEWMIVLSLLVVFFISSRNHFNKEVKDIKDKKEKKKTGTKTDLDKLYELLQEKKRIRFIVIEKAFNVEPEIVKRWSETLEAGGLASVDYPRIGEPELVLTEKKVEKINE